MPSLEERPDSFTQAAAPPGAAQRHAQSHSLVLPTMYTDRGLSPAPTDVPLRRGSDDRPGQSLQWSLFGRGCPRWHPNPGPRGAPRRPDVTLPRDKAQASTPRSQILSAPVVNGWLPYKCQHPSLTGVALLGAYVTSSPVGACAWKGVGRGSWRGGLPHRSAAPPRSLRQSTRSSSITALTQVPLCVLQQAPGSCPPRSPGLPPAKGRPRGFLRFACIPPHRR